MHSPHDRIWQPRIIAHRGVSAHAPENTASAFDRALRDGADGIELDLQLSRDGQILAYHDQWLTKLGRRSRRIRDYTAAELARFDAGAWFGAEFTGERLLELPRILAEWAPRTPLLLELKAHGRGQRGPWDMALVDALIPLLDEYPPDLLGLLSLLSFSAPVLDHLHAHWAKRSGPRPVLVRNLEEPAALARIRDAQWAQYAAICINIDRFTAAESAALQACGKPLYCYTADRPDQIERARQLGCSLLISNDPAACRHWINQNSGGS